MKQMVLIGGGNVGRRDTLYDVQNIDKEIVKMSSKNNPILLFIGLASNYSDSYYDTIKKNFQNLGCKTVYLKKKNIIHNPSLVEDKILSADIIYIGGGDTIKLLECVKKYHLDFLLSKAYENGSVLVGMSAGAILLVDEGFSDSRILRKESNKNEFIRGLGFSHINICPHYSRNSNKRLELEFELKKSKKKVFGIEDRTAIKIVDDKITVIRENDDCRVFNCYYDNKYIEEEYRM